MKKTMTLEEADRELVLGCVALQMELKEIDVEKLIRMPIATFDVLIEDITYIHKQSQQKSTLKDGAKRGR